MVIFGNDFSFSNVSVIVWDIIFLDLIRIQLLYWLSPNVSRDFSVFRTIVCEVYYISMRQFLSMSKTSILLLSKGFSGS